MGVAAFEQGGCLGKWQSMFQKGKAGTYPTKVKPSGQELDLQKILKNIYIYMRKSDPRKQVYAGMH